jgi:hypothetical protein
VGIPRDLYRALLAVGLGLVVVFAAVIFAPYLIDGSTAGWRDGRIWLAVATVAYALPALAWLEHRFGPRALSMKPTRRQRVELTAAVLVAIVALVVAAMAIIPGADT